MAFVYSCCFYFSLRLGGIIIAIFSIVQAVVNIAVLCLAAENIDKIKQFLVPWIDDVSLTYVTDLISYFLEDKVTDLDKYIGYVITTLSFYILGCVFYIYGAYKLINILMFPFILLELLRLFVLTFFMITGLLVLKQNTMDLGLLIGISVIVGFTLVGMFYLWVCLANLPILINEMKEDEQIALIEKLQKIIEKSNLRYSSDWTDQPVGGGRFKLQNQKEIFFVSRNKIVDRPPQYNFKFNTAK